MIFKIFGLTATIVKCFHFHISATMLRRKSNYGENSALSFYPIVDVRKVFELNNTLYNSKTYRIIRYIIVICN